LHGLSDWYALFFVISGFCPETAWRACMSRQAVHLSVCSFEFWLFKPPGRDEYPPGGASVFALAVDLRFVQGN